MIMEAELFDPDVALADLKPSQIRELKEVFHGITGPLWEMCA
jgi:hypothetical protein